MHQRVWLAAAVLMVAAAPTNSAADEAAGESKRVRIEGFHACCGDCLLALTEAVKRVDGVIQLSASRKTRVCEFVVRDESTVRRALDAVRHAGFSGRVQVDGIKVAAAAKPYSEELVADRIRFAGVHLCCRSCATAVARAYAGQEQVTAVDCDVEKGTVTLIGTAMRLAQMHETLHAAGFAGRIVR